MSGIYYVAVMFVSNGTCKYIGNLKYESNHTAPATIAALREFLSEHLTVGGTDD